MPEPTTMIAAGAGAFAIEKLGGKELIVKLLGPTADYLGGAARDFSERGVQNIKTVFLGACDKLGNRIDNPGGVNPKVLKDVLQEAYFASDDIVTDYLSGVLASSRAKVSRDDRGATYVQLVARLSSYQIRAHYIYYSAIRGLYGGSALDLLRSEDRYKMECFVPMTSYRRSMDFGPDEDDLSILAHTLTGLRKEFLVSPYTRGTPESMKAKYPSIADKISGYGFLMGPSSFGASLYLWSQGLGHLTPRELLKQDVSLVDIPEVAALDEVVPAHDPIDTINFSGSGSYLEHEELVDDPATPGGDPME